MPNVNERYVAARPDNARQAELDESPLSIPAVGRFAEVVSRDVEQRLTDDVVEARLAKVRREALARAETGREGERVSQELARYGYTLVRMWLQVVRVEMQGAAAIGRQGVGLDETEIHNLAKDTAARAIAGFRDEQAVEPAVDGSVDLKTGFLSQCVRRLPDAYRARQLQLGRLGGLEEELRPSSVGVHLVRALRHCVTERRGETAHLLRSWTDSDRQRDEIIELTRRALDRATRLYPEVSPDGAGFAGGPQEVRES